MNIEVLSLNCPTRLVSPRLDYDAFFDTALDGLRDQRRYRVFADLERQVGRFPHAIWHSLSGPRAKPP